MWAIVDFSASVFLCTAIGITIFQGYFIFKETNRKNSNESICGNNSFCTTLKWFSSAPDPWQTFSFFFVSKSIDYILKWSWTGAFIVY